MEHTVHDPVVAVTRRFIRMRWRRPLQLAGAALGVAFTSLALAGFAPLDFKIHPVRSQPTGEMVVNGTVTSLVSRDVGSPFDGTVSAVKVRPGQSVKKGQLLFQMDPSPLEAQLAQAKADRDAAMAAYKSSRDSRDGDLRQAQQGIAELQSAIDRARQQLDAASTAATYAQPAATGSPADAYGQPADAATPALAPQAVDPAALADLESRIAGARQDASLRAAEWHRALWDSWKEYLAANKRVGEARALLASADRRSPIDGIVATVAAQDGGGVAACAPVVRVEDPRSFRVVTLVDEKVMHPLQPGAFMPVYIPQGKLAASLDRVEQGMDAHALEYYLFVKPDQPERLLPGQQVEVVVQGKPV